jgi:hypothetical protein
MHKAKRVMNTTHDPKVYSAARKRLLLRCDFCRPHR